MDIDEIELGIENFETCSSWVRTCKELVDEVRRLEAERKSSVDDSELAGEVELLRERVWNLQSDLDAERERVKSLLCDLNNQRELNRVQPCQKPPSPSFFCCACGRLSPRTCVPCGSR